ncbi:hypothetical protein GCM10007275_06920 [Jeotgalicoccus coquinae]|uniref:Cell fate (Sporulation/competence/biofilm development) regulator YmcA (YheA/YmcA/DUF963 family) n=1 Tax=Jeotgalicoccus coquinae TaxID=709509 RepID=A0A6V7RIJ5_9STAP|nr:YlbF family regulator [Jeotgalicoccus coquinae]MBB6422640.1 cell fate (sporulation/competence/biofilm development) regulator YmcA (YheA/YmcA/DUF963 family) [Jeotgalicoccus coquinae]GGE14318.1 hypothetical protein GCM10007275_06920 [Jeotgalicoccus coquinae]CAD2077702.1 putative protein YmcA [Jeotgalicoccus coquinae]
MYTKDEIIEEAKKLGKMMSETDQVEFFKKAEAKIHENQEIREKMASLKSLQQQAVNFQNYGKERAYKMTEEKLAKIEQELDEMPLVDQFKESQAGVNELLQMVSHAISSTVTSEIIESTGGDLMQGETGAAIRNKPNRDPDQFK